jgi:hypothetical protein
VVVGSATAKMWRAELSAAPVLRDSSEINAIWNHLRTQAARTDEREATEPPPPTLARLYWNASASLVAALVSVLAVLYTIRWTGTAWSGYATAGVALLLGSVARRTAWLRYPALGWLTGNVVITIAVIAMHLLG